MARSYQIPGGPLINAAQDGRSYALPGYGHFNDETVAAGTFEPQWATPAIQASAVIGSGMGAH